MIDVGKRCTLIFNGVRVGSCRDAHVYTWDSSTLRSVYLRLNEKMRLQKNKIGNKKHDVFIIIIVNTVTDGIFHGGWDDGERIYLDDEIFQLGFSRR